MTKRLQIVHIFCLVLIGISSIVLNIQPALACQPQPPPPVEIPLNEWVMLIFPPGTDPEGISATASEAPKYPPLPPPCPQKEVVISENLPSDGFIGPVWDIEVTGDFSGLVTVRIYYDEAESHPTEILQIDIVPGDVNVDGKVNCKDLCIIIKALGSRPGGPRWNEYCDLNGNNRIDLKDLCIAICHLGQTSEWTPLINIFVDEELRYIEGDTDHFSLFGIHL
jgi:hypothetical protein